MEQAARVLVCKSNHCWASVGAASAAGAATGAACTVEQHAGNLPPTLLPAGAGLLPGLLWQPALPTFTSSQTCCCALRRPAASTHKPPPRLITTPVSFSLQRRPRQVRQAARGVQGHQHHRRDWLGQPGARAGAEPARLLCRGGHGHQGRAGRQAGMPTHRAATQDNSSRQCACLLYLPVHAMPLPTA